MQTLNMFVNFRLGQTLQAINRHHRKRTERYLGTNHPAFRVETFCGVATRLS
jgi:hypothetical protein